MHIVEVSRVKLTRSHQASRIPSPNAQRCRWPLPSAVRTCAHTYALSLSLSWHQQRKPKRAKHEIARLASGIRRGRSSFHIRRPSAMLLLSLYMLLMLLMLLGRAMLSASLLNDIMCMAPHVNREHITHLAGYKTPSALPTQTLTNFVRIPMLNVSLSFSSSYLWLAAEQASMKRRLAAVTLWCISFALCGALTFRSSRFIVWMAARVSRSRHCTSCELRAASCELLATRQRVSIQGPMCLDCISIYI